MLSHSENKIYEFMLHQPDRLRMCSLGELFPMYSAEEINDTANKLCDLGLIRFLRPGVITKGRWRYFEICDPQEIIKKRLKNAK